jgi:hypothetical protein
MYTTDISTGFDMLEAAFFDADRLPPLSTNRILESQIETIFSHFKSGNKETLFD